MTMSSSNNSNKNGDGINNFPEALLPSSTSSEASTTTAAITILGYGALLSKESSKLTFPNLTNFRYVKIQGYRRVFRHPHLFLLKQDGVFDDHDLTETLELASLSAEKVEDGDAECSFIAAAFDVPTLTDEERRAFVAREPEYYITKVEYYDINDDEICLGDNGIICLASTDENLSKDLLQIVSETAAKAGEKAEASSSFQNTVWNWTKDSGLLPARIYLRHCLLSVEKTMAENPIAYESFLKDTYLIDRETTIKQYLDFPGVYDKIMYQSKPPEHLVSRYSG